MSVLAGDRRGRIVEKCKLKSIHAGHVLLIERFFRTLKEQLLWIRHFPDLAELQEALRVFKDTDNQQWLIERLGFRAPVTVRKEFALTPAA